MFSSGGGILVQKWALCVCSKHLELVSKVQPGRSSCQEHKHTSHAQIPYTAHDARRASQPGHRFRAKCPFDAQAVVVFTICHVEYA